MYVHGRHDQCKPHCILHIILILMIYYYSSFVSLGQQPTCQSNGSDGCCSSSDCCTTEHTVISEIQQCSPGPSSLSPLYETRLVPGLELCLYAGEYAACPNSHVDDRTNSVGDYGKPNWVGAEFESLNYTSFSMTVMWEHADAEILSTLPNLSPVQGYEIRIYKRVAGLSEGALSLIQCFCATDPSMRNVSDIRSNSFTYEEMTNMIVEVRTIPSLIGEDERNRRRNCSLLTGCSTTEECGVDCYSWPQSCLNLTSYSPEGCAPPVYSPPMNVRALMSLIDDSITTNSDNGQLDLSWEPPRVSYELFPVPNMYYITIENTQDTFQFKATNTTRITLSPLNFTSAYTVFITAYVPCSGLSQNNYASVGPLASGCGYFARIEYPPSCDDPSPPLHGWISAYHSISLHSAVTFQCDFGWSPPEQFNATCVSTEVDRLEWVPDPENHTCLGIIQ